MAIQGVKLKDIALEAGVSIAAVSAALNNTGTVSRSMRERVRQVAARMNYEPNFAAQLLKQKKSSDIGLVISDIPERIFGSGYFIPMITGFIRQSEALEIRYQIEYHDPSNAEKIPALLTNGLVGGVLYGGLIQPSLRNWLAENPQFPFVAFEEEAVCNVMSDFSLTFYKAMQYLIALGHKKIGYIGGPCHYRRQQQIESGVFRAIQEFNLQCNPEWIVHLNLNKDTETLCEAVEWGRTLFARNERPTALICSDGRATRGILHAACEAGFGAPRDFSLLACSSQTEAEQTFPAVSSIAWNAPEALLKGIFLLRNLMEHRLLDGKKILIEPSLTLRSTTGKAPQQS
ncbi:MAG: LacI family DNA-binding transcriptional regulator [Victivallaceae bacterium]|nr:LacI family DNA-binding transcriptional regulator [Victivallaceae bacterium]